MTRKGIKLELTYIIKYISNYMHIMDVQSVRNMLCVGLGALDLMACFSFCSDMHFQLLDIKVCAINRICQSK